MIELKKIESTNLEAIGYDEASQEFAVRFHGNKSIYIYEGVPRDLMEQFNAAESKGSFFHAKIRSAFKFPKILEADLLERKES